MKYLSLQSLGVNSQDFSKTLYVFYDKKHSIWSFTSLKSWSWFPVHRYWWEYCKFVTSLYLWWSYDPSRIRLVWSETPSMEENISLAERECYMYKIGSHPPWDLLCQVHNLCCTKFISSPWDLLCQVKDLCFIKFTNLLCSVKELALYQDKTLIKSYLGEMLVLGCYG